MRRTSLLVLALLLGGGCAEAPDDPTSQVSGPAPAGPSQEARPSAAPGSEQQAASSDAVASEANAPTETPAVIDAESLLASTLQQAQAENKRVMVHLGAPW